MDLSNKEIKEFTKRLLKSRLRILCNNGFYGLLLMHMRLKIDNSIETAATDGEYIIFSPDFLDCLSDSELDFILMHEILHVALQHVFRGENFEHRQFNIACDIVVNSIILESYNENVAKITVLGEEAKHLVPGGKEGRLYSAEEVYRMLPKNNKPISGGKGKIPGVSNNNLNTCGSDGDGNTRSNNNRYSKSKKHGNNPGFTDDHSKWHSDDNMQSTQKWLKRVLDAAMATEGKGNSGGMCKGRGLLPAFAERILEELRHPQIDWRTILDEFVQEEITDYSFSPPDRRFDETPFFLPDFNEKEDTIKNVLFMIDTSGSMDSEMITAAFSEIKGAIDQFGGRLEGWLGFFDAAVYEPVPFSDVDSLSEIIPRGGGGTDFSIIFDYVREHMEDNLPISIIIMTDGWAPFPDESMAMGIPVLWLIVDDITHDFYDDFDGLEKITPPWGKIARISSGS